MSYKTYIGYLLALVFGILLFLKSCEKENAETTTKITVKPKEVKIPEINGAIKLPTHTAELPSKQPDTVFIGGDPIYIPSPLDEALVVELAAAKTEIERYKVLVEANRKREYSQDFEDDKVKINSKTTVYGKLEANEIKYTIKPQTVIVNETTIEKEKNTSSKLALFAGGNLQIASKVVPQAEVGLMLNNNTLITAGYNTNNEWSAGVKIRIFNLNK